MADSDWAVGRTALETPEVIDEALSASTVDLVKQAASRFGWRRVRVRPLSRFGYSGARVIVIRQDLRLNKPHALKIADRLQVDREMSAIEACLPTVRSMRAPTRFDSAVTEDGEEQSAICYEYFDGDGAGNPVDLTDIYSECMGLDLAKPPESSAERLIPLLQNALAQLSIAHQIDPDRESDSYRNLFSWYLREKRPSRVHRVMSGSDSFSVHGVTVPSNPLDGLGELLDEVCAGYRAVLIHGDLHLSNIVMDGSTTPNLIDFKWARRGGHGFLDYALLESSMRLMRFPHDIHPRVVFAVDRELNHQFDGGDAHDIAQRVPDELARHRLTEMLRAVLSVRRTLAGSLPAWSDRDWLEYQRTLYLLLAGQQRLSSFPLMRTIVNLHQLRSELGL